MAVTATPIFCQTPNFGNPGKLLSTAATAGKFYDGTDAAGTNMVNPFTAGANGSRLDGVKIKVSSVAGSAPSGTVNANVFHIFANNGSANTTATNNIYLGEIIITASFTMSNTASNGEWTWAPPPGYSLPANWQIFVNSQAAVGATNGAYAVSSWGGDY